MKRVKTGIICFLLLMVFCLIPAKSAQAATAKKLFTITLNDGFVSQKIPVYQYTETDGSVSVAAKKTLRTLPVYAGAKTATISISAKTALYKNTYRSVTYKKKLTLSGTTTLQMILKQKDGTKKTMAVKLTRPSMPKISSLKLSSSTFTPGNYSRMSVKLNMRSSVAVRAYYKIKNSSGKVVYQKNLGTRKSTNYTAYWSGKPSKGNPAGLSADEYVPAGSYKLTGYLQYTVGGKNKFISKTVSFKVKDSSSGENGTSNGSENNNSNETGTSWCWKMILSGDDTLDYIAETICREVLTDKMTEIQRAKALYTWCDKNMTHIYSRINTSSSKAKVDEIAASAACKEYAKQITALKASGKASVDVSDGYFDTSNLQKTKISWAKAGMLQKKGDCLIMALVYQTLLRHAGIEAYIMENTLPSGGGGHHFWNTVKIGSKYYYTDVDITTYQAGISDGSYTFFLRGTNFFYKENRYKTVAVNKKKKNGGYRYAIAHQVSASDCPGR